MRWADTELPSDAAKNINSGMDRAAARAAALTHTAHTLVNAVATPLEGVVKQPVQWVRNVAAAGLAGISGNGSTGADDLIPLAGQGGIAGGDVEDPAEAAAAAKAARVAKEAEQGREKLKRRRHNWRRAARSGGVHVILFRCVEVPLALPWVASLLQQAPPRDSFMCPAGKPR